MKIIITRFKYRQLIVLLIAIYSAIIPLENVLATSIGGSVNKYIGLLIMGLIAIHIVKNNDYKISIHGLKAAFLFGGFAILSSVWIAYARSNSYLSMLINMLLLTVVFIQYPLKESEFLFIKNLIIVVGVGLSLLILGGGRAVSINEISGGRMTLVIGGLTVDNNNLALSLCIPVLYSFIFAYKKNKQRIVRITYVAITGLMLMALVMTGSRGGLIALVAGVAVFLTNTENGFKIRNVVLGGIFVAITGIILQYFVSGDLAERFTLQSVLSNGGTGRVTIWENAIKAFGESNIFRMLIGYGYGSFPDTMKDLFGTYVGSHNDFLGVLLDLGIVGIFLLIYMWISMFKSSKKNDKYSESALLVIMLIGSLSMELLIKKMFWLVVYLVVVPVVQENRDEKEYYLG